MTISFPSNTPAIIDAIRDAIGRDVIFFREYKTPCSACSLDPVTDTSVNSFCTVCSGEGYLYTYSGTTLTAHVTHGPSEFMQWTAGGQYNDGDVRLQIKHSADNLAVVREAVYVTVDDKKFDVRKIMLRGVKAVNRILIDLIEKL